MGNFVSYNNAEALMRGIKEKFDSLAGAYIFKGNKTFAELPAVLTSDMTGFTYNMSEEFTTDARFVEGAGKTYSAGTNVSVADLSTITYQAVTPVGTENPVEEGWYELSGSNYILSEDTTVDSGKTYYEKVVTPNYKFDVNGNFVDVNDIYNTIKEVSDMITGEFNTTTAYQVGQVVVYDGHLYKFDVSHAAGAWDDTEVTETTVIELMGAIDSNLKATIDSVSHMIAPEFDPTQAYDENDIVAYGHNLYSFTSSHAANTPWDSTEVSQVSISMFIEALRDYIPSLIAPEFDSTKNYKKFEIVWYGKILRVFIKDHAAGDLDLLEVESVDNIGEYVTKYLLPIIKDTYYFIAPEFSSSTNYKMFELVWYNGRLYGFNQDHAAGEWTGNDAVEMYNLHDYVTSIISIFIRYPITLLSESIAPLFDETEAYAVGNIVMHTVIPGNDITATKAELCRFTSAHTADTPWNDSEVERISVLDLIQDADPEELTQAQVETLLGFLA